MVTDSDGRPQPRPGQVEWQKVGELTRLCAYRRGTLRCPDQRSTTLTASGLRPAGPADTPGRRRGGAFRAGGGGTMSHTVTRGRLAGPSPEHPGTPAAGAGAAVSDEPPPGW